MTDASTLGLSCNIDQKIKILQLQSIAYLVTVFCTVSWMKIDLNREVHRWFTSTETVEAEFFQGICYQYWKTFKHSWRLPVLVLETPYSCLVLKNRGFVMKLCFLDVNEFSKSKLRCRCWSWYSCLSWMIWTKQKWALVWSLCPIKKLHLYLSWWHCLWRFCRYDPKWIQSFGWLC